MTPGIQVLLGAPPIVALATRALIFPTARGRSPTAAGRDRRARADDRRPGTWEQHGRGGAPAAIDTMPSWSATAPVMGTRRRDLGGRWRRHTPPGAAPNLAGSARSRSSRSPRRCGLVCALLPAARDPRKRALGPHSLAIVRGVPGDGGPAGLGHPDLSLLSLMWAGRRELDGAALALVAKELDPPSRGRCGLSRSQRVRGRAGRSDAGELNSGATIVARHASLPDTLAPERLFVLLGDVLDRPIAHARHAQGEGRPCPGSDAQTDPWTTPDVQDPHHGPVANVSDRRSRPMVRWEGIEVLPAFSTNRPRLGSDLHGGAYTDVPSPPAPPGAAVEVPIRSTRPTRSDRGHRAPYPLQPTP